MSDDLPDHWSELSAEERRALLEIAKGRIWWEQTWQRLGWLKNLGVILMGIAVFLTWGRDALAHWLSLGGGK